MATSDATELLRAGLLEGSTIMLARGDGRAGAGSGSVAEAVGSACSALGARVLDCVPIPAGSGGALEESELDAEVDRALARAGSIQALVVDGAGIFSAGAAAGPGGAPEGEVPAGGRAALGACLDGSWSVTRSVANRAFLAREQEGRIFYVAPRPGAGEHAEAARAGLENLARTLAIEWARHRVTALAIAPGDSTTAGEVAALTAYLASPAGAYFSGCLLDMRGAA